MQSIRFSLFLFEFEFERRTRLSWPAMRLILCLCPPMGLTPMVWADASQTVATDKAGAVSELPSPLTLSALLSIPETLSPELMQIKAQKRYYQSQQASAASEQGLHLNMEGRLGWRQYQARDQDHHRLALHLGKQLYDFGQTQAAVLAKQTRAKAQDLAYQAQAQRFRIALMRAYFDVVLADFQYRIDNEAMAVAYIDFDKAQDQHELNRLSDVTFLRLEAEYERLLTQRRHSEYEQRRTREALANLAGQPGQLPDQLALPELTQLSERKLSTLEAYQAKAIDNHWLLQQMQRELVALQHELTHEQAANRPEIRADAWGGRLSSYPEQREGHWSVGVSVHYPLYEGGTRKAQVQGVRAKIDQLKAQIAAKEQALRDQVAQVYFDLELAKAKARQYALYSDYADLYFEYNRGVYENEMQTDFGDAMVKLSQSTFNIMQQRFEQALDWAQLDYLTGTPMPLDQYQ